MPNDISVLTAATVYPCTLNEAKMQVRVEVAEHFEDDYLNSLIQVATSLVEIQSDRTFVNAAKRLTLPAFLGADRPIYIPGPPLVSIQQVLYIADDASPDGTQTAFTDYQLSLNTSQIWPTEGFNWPSTRIRPDAVQIDYTSGYGATAAGVPKIAKQAILMLIAQWYLQREDISDRQSYTVPHAVDCLCDQLRPGDEFAEVR